MLMIYILAGAFSSGRRRHGRAEVHGESGAVHHPGAAAHGRRVFVISAFLGTATGTSMGSRHGSWSPLPWALPAKAAGSVPMTLGCLCGRRHVRR